MTSEGGAMTLEGGSMTSEGSSMTSEGGTLISGGGSTFFRESLRIPRVYCEQGVIIWVLEMNCGAFGAYKSFQDGALRRQGGGGRRFSIG